MLFQKVNNPILCPVGIFPSVCPVKKPAMTPMARCDYPNLGMVLDRGYCKHGIRNKGIILCCDDESGDINGVEHTACACGVAVVEFAGVSPIGGGVAVVEFAEDANPVQSAEIPL